MCVLIKGSPRILTVTIYRPPKQSERAFIDEFSDLLSIICVEFDCLIISGDFNLQIDKSDNIYVKDFLALLDTFSLTQHVQGPWSHS